MARDRQRAKQRKARRAGQNPGPAPTEPHRTNVPGELDHASGEADEFDAALVSGAGGRPTDADGEPAGDELLDDEPTAADEPYDEDGELLEDERTYEDDEADLDDAALAEEEADDGERAATASRRGGRAEAPAGRRAAPAARRAEAPAASGPARFLAFLRASWAELQRVQWPDRRAVAQATAVVLGFVVIAGVYLGVADRIAQEVVDLII